MADFKRVDSDWKTRLEADRAKLQEKLERDRGSAEAHLPPASFLTVVSTFATQAMIALGEAELPGGEGRKVDLPAARFAIDTIGVLKEKTKGNLLPAEEKAVDEVLQNLRLRFVQKSNEAGPQETGGA